MQPLKKNVSKNVNVVKKPIDLFVRGFELFHAGVL